VLAAVVFNDQPQVLVNEVVTSVPAAVTSANDQIHTRLREAGQHEQQANAGLLW